MCFGNSGDISFGRCLSAFWAAYFAVQDYHFFLTNGHHLVDNATLLTHLGVITTSYGITSAKDALNTFKGNNGQA